MFDNKWQLSSNGQLLLMWPVMWLRRGSCDLSRLARIVLWVDIRHAGQQIDHVTEQNSKSGDLSWFMICLHSLLVFWCRDFSSVYTTIKCRHVLLMWPELSKLKYNLHYHSWPHSITIIIAVNHHHPWLSFWFKFEKFPGQPG